MKKTLFWNCCARFLIVVFTLGIAACGGAQSNSRNPTAANERIGTADELPQDRLAKAEAMFRERCKTAGERIYRTVENVEGIFLMKVRPSELNYEDQFAMTDPYGDDLGGEGYIKSFLRGEYQTTHSGSPHLGSPPRLGYGYVELVDSKDGKRYRYTGRIDEPWTYDNSYSKTYKRFVLDKVVAREGGARYAVTYEDISTYEDRKYWIAGSSLKVIDLQNNEVIAERIGYMMDRGQGDKSGGRSPWLIAANNACPSFQRNSLLALGAGQGAAAQSYQTLDFVEKIARPTRGK